MEAGTAQRLLDIDPALLQEGQKREQWEAISDLDNFFVRVYTYYRERGLWCILASKIISLLTFAFIILLLFFLVEILNWPHIFPVRHTEQECAEGSPFLSPRPSLLFSLYYLVFSMYWVYSLLQLVWDVRPLLEMRDLYRDKLHLEDSELQVITWDEIVVRLVELQRTSRLVIVKDDLTAHDIANRIMRKENFLIGMLNTGLLPVLPFGPGYPAVFSKALEWDLYVTILDAMFDKQFRIRQSFTLDVGALQRRFVLCGLLNLIFAPCFAPIMLFLFLKRAEEFRRRPASSTLGRDFSRHARWLMREFNELPHVFEARIAASTADASAYVQQFPAPLTTLIARFATFVVSSASAILLLLSMCNESLLWWLALLSTMLAVSRSFDGLSGDGTSPFVQIQPDALLISVARHTHHMPPHWRGRGHTRHVFSEFGALYQYKVMSLLQEVLGALTAPFAMLMVLPQRAGAILDFVRTFTVYVEGVGHVCSFALFDFERHGDTSYGAPRAGPHGMRSRDGKMEKAYVNFRAQHPSWRDDRYGEALLANIAGADGLPPGADGTQQQSVPASPTQPPPEVDTSGPDGGGKDGGTADAPIDAGSSHGGGGAPVSDPLLSPMEPPPLRPADLPGAMPSGPVSPPVVTHAVSHSVRFAPGSSAMSHGGVSALGGTIGTLGGTMGGLNASAFGASALHMLTRSSTHLGGASVGGMSQMDIAQHVAMVHGGSIAHGGSMAAMAMAHHAQIGGSIADSISHHVGMGASLTHHPHAAVVASEVRAQHFTAGLYSALDQFHVQQTAHHSYSAATAAAERQSELESPLPPGMRSDGLLTRAELRAEGRLPPLAGTDVGDYELAPAPPDVPEPTYEMRPVVQAAPGGLPPHGYAPLPNPPLERPPHD